MPWGGDGDIQAYATPVDAIEGYAAAVPEPVTRARPGASAAVTRDQREPVEDNAGGADFETL